jgi:hypothetical protein
LLDNPAALGAIMDQLLKRPLGDYSGSGRAPATTAKRKMRDDASGEVEQWLMEHAAEHITPYTLVSVEKLFELMPDDLQRIRTARADLRRGLRARFNGIAIGEAIRILGDRFRVWAVGPEAKAVAAEPYKSLCDRWQRER